MSHINLTPTFTLQLTSPEFRLVRQALAHRLTDTNAKDAEALGRKLAEDAAKHIATLNAQYQKLLENMGDDHEA